MKLLDIMEQIPQGELKDLALGGGEGNRVLLSDYPKILPHLNLGLTELCKRFPIHIKSLFLTLEDSVNIYILDTSNTHTILDVNGAAYSGDLLQIEELFDSDDDPIFLNNRNESTSYKTLSHNKLYVPSPVAGDIVEVVYRANHRKILNSDVPTEASLSTVEIDIPVAYTEPLLFYLASRLFSGLPPVEGVKESAQYMRKFEISCQELTKNGLLRSDHTVDTKLSDSGWP